MKPASYRHQVLVTFYNGRFYSKTQTLKRISRGPREYVFATFARPIDTGRQTIRVHHVVNGLIQFSTNDRIILIVRSFFLFFFFLQMYEVRQ